MKVLFDAGLVTHDEPFKKLAHQGMILGEDHQKMSKSRNNGIAADEVSQKYGADALRTFVCFMGPLESEKPWSATGIEGVKRFLDRVTRLILNEENQCIATNPGIEPISTELEKLLHKTIKKVTEDIEKMSFNTAISAMMILVNELYKANVKPKSILKPLIQLLMPFAPYMAEELWEKMGGEGFVSLAPWPKYDSNLIADDTVTIGVQVNGKMRGTIETAMDAPEEVALKTAYAVDTVMAALNGKTPDKIIYKAGKILNLIIK
jgi:leucyl-tRNA synthetase